MKTTAAETPLVLNNTEYCFPKGYFLPRDFEIVQPLYDMAFLMQIMPRAPKEGASKYRTLSLNKAAHNLDSYSSGIANLLNGGLDGEFDFIPSPRMKAHLTRIMEIGSLDALMAVLSEKASGCLRLRAIKGLGNKLISQFYSESPSISDELLRKSTKKCGLSENKIISIFNGQTYGRWQSAHVIPPLMRIMRSIEKECGPPIKFWIDGLTDGIAPIDRPFQVHMASETGALDFKAVKHATGGDPFFSSNIIQDGQWYIQHNMGWHFDLIFDGIKEHYEPLHCLAYKYDPTTRPLPKNIIADLHMHTYWSDGIGTPANMISAAAAMGLQYMAITDHSQSSKLQGGLKPATWLRQAIALKNTSFPCLVLHGLEVDILHDGQLDMPSGLLKGMDFVIGSFHSGLHYNREKNTERLLRAIESDHIDVIGHPTAKLLGRPGEPNYYRPPIEFDWDQILEACAKRRVALEINCFPFTLGY